MPIVRDLFFWKSEFNIEIMWLLSSTVCKSQWSVRDHIPTIKLRFFSIPNLD